MAALDQRYLFLNDIGGTDGPGAEPGVTQAWGNLTADKDDIVMYNGTDWIKVFDASLANKPHFIVNNFTAKQLFFAPGDTWILAIDGEYQPGSWRIFF